jgi:ABC-type cobalamin/Fe3+-siderophores transport system ATPase subunit
LARQATASAAASEDSSSPSGSAPSVHQLLARGAAAVPSVHHGGKLVLRSVSGATLASVAAGARAASQRPAGGAPAGGGAADAAALSARLPPMVCGIMGPSGAGKTSLLDCLVRTRARACIYLFANIEISSSFLCVQLTSICTARHTQAGRKTVGTVTGQVRLNGKAMTPAQLRLLSGYVVQDDILPGLLSVKECLEFQAKLRVPGSAATRASRVATVLQRLKLVRQQHTMVGNAFARGISGGEKRRVSVAIELLSEPAVLFLDEPTTGQDSTTAVGARARVGGCRLIGLTSRLNLLRWLAPRQTPRGRSPLYIYA